MATLFVRHNVADFAAWKKGYDEAKNVRDAGGVTSDGVYQSADNPNDITVYHEFPSIEAARAFASSDDLKAAMQSLGVVGAPQIWFTNRV
jgi:quinol monooxygenase YgiN